MAEYENKSMLEILKHLQQNQPEMMEYVEYQASLLRIKFLALVREGFSTEQAFELCKGKLIQ